MIHLIVLHVAGVLVNWFLTGENVIRAMIDGRKELSDSTAALESALAGVWRALAVAAVVLLRGGYLIAAT